MARSFEEIKSSMIAEKNTKTALDALSLDSAVSEALLWIEIIAESIRVLEVFIDSVVAEINTLIANQLSGTPSWYRTKCFEFQLGDQLNSSGNYPIIDPVKQIITRAAVVEGLDGILTIKVAKGEVGAEVALTPIELQQFSNYMQKTKYAGTRLNIISLNADQLKLTATVYFDGIYSEEVMKERVQVALEDFLIYGIDFNGDILITTIIDRLQEVEGLIDVTIEEAKATVGVEETIFTRIYSSFSGYLKEATGTGNTFNETITYIPQSEAI